MSVINQRYKSLKKIYKYLGDMHILDEGEIVNYDQIIKDFYHLNLLLFQTYNIFNSDSGEIKSFKKRLLYYLTILHKNTNLSI